MTTPPAPAAKPVYSRFAIALLVGGLIAVGAGSTALYRANALEADSIVVPGVVTKVGDRQGRYVSVTYRYTPSGKGDAPLEKTVMAHHRLVENWAAERKIQVRVSKSQPAESDLAENNAAVATGLQWIVFGVLATVFGTLRLHKRPEEA